MQFFKTSTFIFLLALNCFAVSENKDSLLVAFNKKNISENGEYMTDFRDGQKYQIIVFNNKAWMKQNLAFSISTPKQCLAEDELFCKKYGRFYNHKEALKACPKGWHLPRDSEWRDFIKWATPDWNNLGKGGCKLWDGYCESNSTGHYWSASIVKKYTARAFEFKSSSKVINRFDTDQNNGLYVRCVTDLR